MTATPLASTPPWATCRYTWITSRSGPNSFLRRCSRRTPRRAVVPEVPGIILVSAVAAIGVLLASLALALPSRAQSADGAEILLPDPLSLLSKALTAGLSRPQALDTVARNTAAPVADELSRVIREMNIGSATERALAAMVRRTGSEDLDLIVTAIGIQASVGGNLARILENISHTIRQRVHVKGQISAMTAQARASGLAITR